MPTSDDLREHVHAGTGAPGAAPRIRELGPRECEKILMRNRVGRLAYSFRDRVSITPLHYVYDDGWLYGRTSPSDKLDVLRHSRWVAFEVDEVNGLFDWRSVVARGAFYLLESDGAPIDQRAYERGMALVRRIEPEAGTASDRAAHRTVLFRIHVDDVSGREATTRGATGTATIEGDLDA